MPGMRNGKPLKATVHMAVLYDPSTGHIAHHHRIIQLDPKQKVSKSELEARTKELATQHGWDVSKLKMLHVDHAKLKKGIRYKVDSKARKLIAVAVAQPTFPSGPLRLKG